MFNSVFKKLIVISIVMFTFLQLQAQKLKPFLLPETGQTLSYTTTAGEDADYIINPVSYTDNGDGTITDNNTGLMWQKVDGGEMTYENAVTYCDNLTLANYTDWRLPTGIELFSINNQGKINPAVDTIYFSKTLAEYWWSSEKRADNSTMIWVTNAGGGIGAHPKTETTSAGGAKRFHVRAVRSIYTTTFSVSHFTDNGNGTVTDNYTGLVWQQIQSTSTMSWEEALAYSKTVTLGGKNDWRLPNVKEIQSLNDVSITMPSFNKTYFPNIQSGNYWTSTTLFGTTAKAWDINVDYGIVSQNDKTLKENVLLVRGGTDNSDMNLSEIFIPSGIYSMGDHIGFVDPKHTSDELPLHDVKIDSFYMAKTKITTRQFLNFLNSSLLSGKIQVKNNTVYLVGDTNTICYTYQNASYYSIGYNGKLFYIADFRANHPMVGVRWHGAAAFCNWMSLQNGLSECYNLTTDVCDFTKNGYRLPTEAEWEWAGRGGQTTTYYNYPWGNDVDKTKANFDNSQDPYESTNTALYPYTTPVGFYDGSLRLKSEYNWPGSVSSYQTANGTNGFGLQDMAGNAWEFVNDWYSASYFSSGDYDNPKGPSTGGLMPDGKQYKGMRGGNWYNGDIVNSTSDGHSRVSNRNPSYFRGPQDPNHPWYHIGMRVVRNYSTQVATQIDQNDAVNEIQLTYNYPNPFSKTTTIQFSIPESGMVVLNIYNSVGQNVASIVNEKLEAGLHSYQWNAEKYPAGAYTYQLQAGQQVISKKMILYK